MNPSNLCDTQLSIDDWELDTSSSSWLDREDELLDLLDDDESDNMAPNDGQGEAIVPDDAVDLDSFFVGSDKAGSFVTEEDSSSHFHEFDCNMADDCSFILPDSQEQSNQASRSSIEKHIALIGELMEKSECSRRLIENLIPSSKLSSPRRKSIASYIAGMSKIPSTVRPPAVCSEDEESLSSLSEAVFCALSSMPSVPSSKTKPSPKKRRQRQVKQGAKKKKQAPRNPKNLTAASFKDKSYQSTGLIVRNGLSLKIKPSREDVSKTGRAGKKRMLAVAAKKQQHARRITSTCQSC